MNQTMITTEEQSTWLAFQCGNLNGSLNTHTRCLRNGNTKSLHKIKWIELNVQPDHVQGTAEIPFTMSPSMALQILKGLSAKLFFEYHPKARLRYPKGHLWSRGRFAASLGFIQVEVANNYVRNQDEHHGTIWIMED